MLNFMYITADPAVARIAQAAGVQRIFLDMEVLDKAKRQGGMNTVQNAHTFADIAAVRAVLNTSQLLVRVNHLHRPQAGFPGTKAEIEGALAAGADVLMLPYFHTAREVQIFLELVDGRARVCPLLETAEAVEAVDDIIALPGLDEIFVGLNDLSISAGYDFMFEALADGTIERLAQKFNAAGLPWGFGGIASLGRGMLHSENVIAEHYRLGSSAAILSRSFCNAQETADLEVVRMVFETGIASIREYEGRCAQRLARGETAFFEDNRAYVSRKVTEIALAKRQAAQAACGATAEEPAVPQGSATCSSDANEGMLVGEPVADTFEGFSVGEPVAEAKSSIAYELASLEAEGSAVQGGIGALDAATAGERT